MSVAIPKLEQAVYEKCIQNPALAKTLKNTGSKTLTECNQYDIWWGIGLSLNDPLAKDHNAWKGKNKMGDILEYARDRLPDEL